MGIWLYGWIIDHWGVNVAGILLILFVVLYFYSETFGIFSITRQNSLKSTKNNTSELNLTTSSPEITTALAYLKSSEK